LRKDRIKELFGKTLSSPIAMPVTTSPAPARFDKNQEPRWDGGFTQGILSPSSESRCLYQCPLWNETQRRV
jgi:hypothetical protein